MKLSNSLLKLSLVSILAISSQQAMALTISSGTGNYGTGSANGSVTAPPGSTDYAYVSTFGSTATDIEPFGFTNGTGDTNGSKALTEAFSAKAGDNLSFNFNYITSEGGFFADFAYVRLINAADSSQAALIVTARTAGTGNVVDGQFMPASEGTTAPATIQPGTTWSQLGSDSGTCYTTGCGNTGWLTSQYTFTAGGNYILEFGVSNWGDTNYASGLALSNVAITAAVPEPETYAMMLAGLGLVGFAARRRKLMA